MANIFCDTNAETSSGANACTETVKLYKSSSRAWECCYIDTRGLNDTAGRSDETSFNEILKLMFANKKDGNVFRLNLVLWFVSDDVRATDELQRQARFIQSFATNSSDNIWDTVLIVSKGSISSDSWADGAIEAARRACANDPTEFDLPSFRCWIMGKPQKDNTLQELFERRSPKERHALLLYKEEEILETIMSKAANRRQFTVKFELIKCRNCNVTTDPRILDGPCHVNKKLAHPGTEQGYHKGERTKLHTKVWVAPRVVDGIKLGFRYGFVPGAAVLGVLGLFYWGKWCAHCKEDVETPGCKDHCDKCWRIWDDNNDPCGIRWSCCKADAEKDKTPCTAICSKCDKEWGSTSGCDDSARHELQTIAGV